MKKLSFNILILILVFGYGCTPEPLEIELENQFGALPKIPFSPQENPTTPKKIELGEALFWDPILSGEKDVACVTCHHPKNGYTENLDLSIGVGGQGLSTQRNGGTLVKRNSITLLNSAFNGIDEEKFYDPNNAVMFWDNREKSLELQAIQPMLSAEEMRGNTYAEADALDSIVLRLEKIPAYVTLFESAFGNPTITPVKIGNAIAAFERTLVATNSRFDQYVRGDEDALTILEKRGMIAFNEVGCSNCHSGPMFSDFQLHILSVPENDKLTTPDDGDGTFAFRTASLRNLKFTAPYMHNGIFESLEDVLEFYDDVDGESQNPNISSDQLDQKLKDLNFADDKTDAIIAFIKTLNDDSFPKEELEQVPSGLPVGGNIE